MQFKKFFNQCWINDLGRGHIGRGSGTLGRNLIDGTLKNSTAKKLWEMYSGTLLTPLRNSVSETGH